MMKRRIKIRGTPLFPLLFVITISSFTPIRKGEAAGTERFALVVGSNTGTQKMKPLLYAERDAARFSGILKELCQVMPENLFLVDTGSLKDAVKGFEKIKEAIRISKGKGRKTMLIFYYSGHADEERMFLKGGVLPFKRLKDLIKGAGADVKISIIDSCRSGEMVRLKGARKVPPFLIEIKDNLIDEGDVIITSSSWNEDSQESDSIKGGYFSHFLMIGLRGAADYSGDGRVSLHELYRFAYNETIFRTSRTRAGTQHPSYMFELKGKGEIIISSHLTGEASISFPKEEDGVFQIFNKRSRTLIGEIEKKKGEKAEIWVMPGRYLVQKRGEERLYQQEFALASDGVFTILIRDMKAVPFDEDYSRGIINLAPLKKAGITAKTGYQTFFSGEVRENLIPPTPLAGLELELINFPAPGMSTSLDLSGGGGFYTLEFPYYDIPVFFASLNGGAGLYYGLAWPWGRLYMGPRIGAIYLFRDFLEPARDESQDFVMMTPGFLTGLEIRLTRTYRLRGEGRVYYLYYSVDEVMSLGYGEFFLGISKVF